MQPLAFICERKAIRLLIKDKVEVISLWDNARYYSASGFVDLPAVIRLKYSITRNFFKRIFSRGAVFKRDNFGCQYCQKQLTSKQITLDHIVPKSRGGISSFENCVAACYECNIKKGSKLLNEIGMSLEKRPETPEGYLVVSPKKEDWHTLWDIFTQAL
jgi:hypothetical protein